MFSNGATDPTAGGRQPKKRWSLAARLAVWNAGSAFALILATTGFLFWASVRNLDREDDEELANRVRALRVLMQSKPGDLVALRQEIAEEWEAHERTRVHMRILDDNGRMVVETPGMSQLLPADIFPAPSEELRGGTDRTSKRAGTFRCLAVVPTGESGARFPYVVQVAMDRGLETELRADYRRDVLIVLAVALVLCGAVGYQVARRAIRPIHEITDTASRIRPTNLGERIVADSLPAELQALAATFNQMLDRLEQSFDRLSRFSADIAHELRTPVSALRGQVEVALNNPRSIEEYREILTSNLEECERLARLIDRLLFVARAENPKTEINREQCALEKELRIVRDFYAASADSAGVGLLLDAPGTIQGALDRPLFQRAVGNLVANALAHTPAGGTVRLSARGNGASVTVEVADTGSGIAASHLPYVFDRFYRADGARSSVRGNVGLGLSIVRSIVEMHGGNVAITSQPGQGTCVTLQFPAVAQVKKA